MIPSPGDGQRLECLRTLDVLGYDLTDLSELSDLHLQALARNALHLSMREQLRDTRLRTLQELIWQCGARRPRVSIGDHLRCARVVLGASKGKPCWSAVGINVDGILGRMATRDPHYAMQLRLQAVFGVRRRQLFGLCPHHADLGDRFQVITPDRSRQQLLPIGSAGKRAAVDAAKELVRSTGAALHPKLRCAETELLASWMPDWQLVSQQAEIWSESMFGDLLATTLDKRFLIRRLTGDWRTPEPRGLMLES